MSAGSGSMDFNDGLGKASYSGVTGTKASWKGAE